MYKIYKVYSLESANIYIGITRQTLNEAFSSHKRNFKKWQNNLDKKGGLSLYHLFNRYEPENCHIELIEECEDKSRKDYWINNLKYNINKYGWTYRV